jgi:phage portal protein BeeE
VKDIKTLSLSPRDMEFINQRHLTTDKVSATFGVAKFLL